MRTVTVESTSIRSFSYDAATEELAVVFAHGGTHIYSAVPVEVVDAFEATTSAGKFFSFNIRNKFAGRKG